MTASGVIDLASHHSVPDTIDRLESLAKSNGLLVFARIDFSGDAARAGLTMHPMQMLVFGHPKAGTPLLIEAPRSGLDLPVKALAWLDSNGQVWVSLNDLEYLARRHGVSAELAQRLAGATELARKAAEWSPRDLVPRTYGERPRACATADVRPRQHASQHGTGGVT